MKGKELIDSICGDFSYETPEKLYEYAVLSLTNEELELLADSLRKHYVFPSCIEKEIRLNNYIASKEKATKKRNHNVQDLLEWYKDKKSKKVVLARKELQERFFGLSYDDQLEVMTMMLHGNKSELTWCYKILGKWWSNDIINPLFEVWDTRHDERCGRILTKNCPVERLRPRVSELSFVSNYYRLCRRLAQEPWFTIDKDLLKESAGSGLRYLTVMSQTKEGLPNEEAWAVIYREIAGVFRCGSFGMIEKFDIYDTVEKILYLTAIKEMGKMLSKLIRMGYINDVKEFILLDEDIHRQFIHDYEMDIIQVDRIDGMSSDKEQAKFDLYREYARFVERQIPDVHCSRLELEEELEMIVSKLIKEEAPF